MHTLIRTEVLKLRTVRSPWLLLAASPLLVLAGISGLVISGGNNLRDPATQAMALAHVGLTSLFTLAFGILAVAGEYRHKTITDSYLTTPGRSRVVGAKLIAYPVFGALAGLVASAAVRTSPRADIALPLMGARIPSRKVALAPPRLDS